MTTQTNSKSNFSKILKNVLKFISIFILVIILTVVVVLTTLYLNDNLYFFKKIEQISNGNSFILYTLILLNSILFASSPFNFEPIVFLTSVYYYKNFQFYQGFILSMLSTFIATNIGSILIMSMTRKFIYPRTIRIERNWNFYIALAEVADNLGLLLVVIVRLINTRQFYYNIVFGCLNISIPQLIIGNIALFPRYLSISVLAFVIGDADIFKDRLINLRSDPASSMLFLTISLISSLILVGLVYKSYLKVKDRVPLPTEENPSVL
ncbi:Uncharacterized protein CTYZ_00001679 [Cryptosporidium tyzzeri]|nr:Uncharacterized protein CTYZ_00001679 [Cryptosporidium tyzzeri]